MILLDSYVKIYRLSQVSGNRTSFTTLTTSISATTQPLGDSKAEMNTGAAGKQYKIFLDSGIDIKDGDQIRDVQGNIYQVMSGGIDNRTDGFVSDYIGVRVQKIYGNSAS